MNQHKFYTGDIIYVRNGGWYGIITQKDGEQYVQAYTGECIDEIIESRQYEKLKDYRAKHELEYFDMDDVDIVLGKESRSYGHITNIIELYEYFMELNHKEAIKLSDMHDEVEYLVGEV